MNLFNTYATRLVLAAVVTASALLAPDASAQSAGTVTLTGSTSASCQYSAMSVAPNGAITVTCGSTANPVPSCTISGPSQVNTGGSGNLTASCSNSPITNYVWAVTPSVAGFVSPNSATLSGGLPDGTYNFTVTAANANGTGPTSASYSVTFGTPTTAPTCTSTTATSPINVGDNSQLSAVCSGAASYSWAATSAPTGVTAPVAPASNPSTLGPFPAAGTYTYQLTATNAAGSTTLPMLPYVVTIVVNATGGGGGTCPTIATVPSANGDNVYNLRFNLKPGQTGSTGFDWPMPAYPTATMIRMFTVKATTLESPAGLQHTVTISPCPGQMVPTVAACSKTGGNGGFTFTVGAGTACTLPPGRYYINVKQTTSPTGTNTCVPSGGTINYCSSVVQGTPL